MAMRATTSTSSSISPTASPDDPTDLVRGTITWAIPRFLIAGRPLLQQEWNSPELIIGKGKEATRWYLRCSKGAAQGILNPDNHVSVHLCCKSCEERRPVQESPAPCVVPPNNGGNSSFDDLEIWAKFRISLINKNGSECYTRTCKSLVPFSPIIPRMGFNNFISVLALNIHVSDLLPCGAITLFCEVELAPDLILVPSMNRHVMSSSQSNLATTLSKMLDTDLFSDVTLVSTVDGEEHKGHKAVLAACSPVFKAMFDNETREKHLNRVVIEDLEGSTIRAMLEYVYKGSVGNISATGLELFQAAEKYQMLGLSKFCQEALTSSLTAANAGQILAISHMYVADKLKKECFDFISRNAKSVISTDSWIQLERTQPQLAIEFFRRNISERRRKRSNEETDTDSD